VRGAHRRCERVIPACVLVTGAEGFIGSRLSSYLEGRGSRVIRGVRRQARGSEGTVELELPTQDLGPILERFGPDLVVHAAGTSSVQRSFEQTAADFRSNVASTQSLLAALAASESKPRLMFLSSAAVYGTPLRMPIKETQPVAPISPYGVHKAAAELLCRYYARVHGVPTLRLRIFSAYGPGLKRQILWDVCQKWQRSGEIVLSGTGCETRDLLHVSDVVSALALAADRAPFDGRAINVASGTAVTMAHLAGMLIAQLGAGHLRFTHKARRGDPSHWQASIERLSRLGFKQTVGLEEGVQEYVAWVRREQFE